MRRLTLAVATIATLAIGATIAMALGAVITPASIITSASPITITTTQVGEKRTDVTYSGTLRALPGRYVITTMFADAKSPFQPGSVVGSTTLGAAAPTVTATLPDTEVTYRLTVRTESRVTDEEIANAVKELPLLTGIFITQDTRRNARSAVIEPSGTIMDTTDTIASSRAASAQSELLTAYDIAMADYSYQANGRYPSTRKLARAMNTSEDELQFRALNLPAAKLRAVTAAAARPRHITRITGLAAGRTHIGVQVFDYNRRGDVRRLPATRQGNAVLLTRMDGNAPATTWWIFSPRAESLPAALEGTFYGSTPTTRRWYNRD